MGDLSHKQAEVLEHPTARAILDFLKEQEYSQTLGEIKEGIDFRDVAVVFRHLAKLVDVRLVEQVPGTTRYRVVGK
jgi:DNA-binding IclR family transcriptional regulator